MGYQKSSYGDIDQIEKCVLWEKTAKNGKKFLAGKVRAGGKVFSIVLFANTYKQEGDNKPVYQFGNEKKQEEKQLEL